MSFNGSPSSDNSSDNSSSDDSSDSEQLQSPGSFGKPEDPQSSCSDDGSFAHVTDANLLDLPQVYQFTGKPKVFSKKNLPETIRTPTLKKCKCTGKGQQCTHNLCNKAITDANNNIETLYYLVEKKTIYSRSYFDTTKEKIEEYRKHCSNQLKQGQKIAKQRNGLKEKIAEKDRDLKQAKEDLKKAKDKYERLEKRS